MVTLRIRVPAPSSMLLANLLAVLGLVAIVAAVGGLAGAWWAVLAGGLFAVLLGWVGMTYAAAAEQRAVVEQEPGPAAAAVDERQAVPEPWRAVEEPAAA